MEKNLYKPLEEIFRNPPNEYRMMPFWFWNHEMVEKEVQRQIRDHNDHGIGGEFIHSRHGRLTPYMGKRWLENVEAAADQCKERNMPCFLYDEDNWPSGPASGFITGPYHPENRGKWLAIFDEDVYEGGEKVEYPLDYKNISSETTFYAAIAVPNPDDYPDFGSTIEKMMDVSEYVKDDVFIWDVPEGEWCVIFFCICVNSYNKTLNGYIDILRKQTVSEFIDQTHKKYIDYFIEMGKRDYIGTVVPGIFTDEPSMAHVNFPQSGFLKHVIFTADMPTKFKEMHGYNFNDILIPLFFESGKTTAKYRCHYWETATSMYVDAFYKQIYDFCEQYSFKSTGHVNSEGRFPEHIVNQGDFFKVFEYMHYGGCDQLNEDVRPDYIEDLWNLETDPYFGFAQEMMTASKFASSAAHLLGKPRVLVEVYGSSSWEINLASCKRINDFLIATGCDLFVPHDFAYSEDGYRKQDHPASFYHQPYFTHWNKIGDHNGRLCSVLNASEGVLNPEMLLFYSTNSFYAELQGKSSNLGHLIGKVLTHNADCLYRQQLDFELANEDLMIGSKFIQNQFKIRKESFKVIILGATTCISKDFAKFLKEFYDNGGKIIASMILPFKDKDVGESQEIIDSMKYIFGIDSKSLFNQLNSGKIKEFKLIEKRNKFGGRGIFIQTFLKEPFRGPYYPLFEEACRKCIPVAEQDIVVLRDDKKQKHASYIMAKHKTNENREFYFFANTSREAAYEHTKVVLDVLPKKVELWDTLTGEIKLISDFEINKGKLVLYLDFPVYQSYLFVITPGNKDEIDRNKSLSRNNNNNNANGILIEQIDLGKSWKCQPEAMNGAMMFEKWNSSYKVEAGKGWKYESTRTFSHKFHISNLNDIKPVKLVIEGLVGDYGWGKDTHQELKGGDRATFDMNGVEFFVNDKRINVSFDFNYEYLDPCWIVKDISNSVVPGMNEVKMVCKTKNHRTFHVVTDPWRLIGNFEVEDKDGIPYLKRQRDQIELDDITKQGFSRYHGGFSYIQERLISPKYKGRKFILNIENSTDCIEVWINDTQHEILWNKWQTDISNHIKPGEKNVIKLVYYGVAQNMMQTNTIPQGILGKVSLDIYK